MLSLATILETSARDRPDKTALMQGPVRMSYRDLDARAQAVAADLAGRGIGPGDIVALACPNVPAFPVFYFGVLKTGATVLPVSILLKRDEMAYLLNDSGAKALVCHEGSAELPLGAVGRAAFGDAPACEHLIDPDAPLADASFDTVQRAPGDTAVVLYTSGTTGRPKGAMLTHANLLMNAQVCVELGDIGPEDVVLVALPLFHVFGQVVQMLAALRQAATVILAPRFEPGLCLGLMESGKVTLFSGVPTMLWALLTYPDAEKHDLAAIASSLRQVTVGGASTPVEILRGFEKKFDVTVLEGYGLSETSPGVSFNRRDRERKVGSVGLPVWGVEVQVVDPEDCPVPAGEAGEVVVRGHCVMKGYLGRPEETAEALRGGWFHTGDIGRFDEDGYLYIVDRLKEMIIRGGFNVYPREVEELLVTHPEISLAAVVGVPDEQYGEEVKAFVVPAAGASPEPEAIVAWARERLAGYKYPRIVELRESLPLGATGKILKRDLC